MDRVELVREFRFEAAHHLPAVPKGHKCRRLHGHSFRVAVAVQGPIGEESGWYIDYAEIDAAIVPVRDALDHRYLNEIEGLENPTSEVLARWIWRKLKGTLPGLCRITVRETCTATCNFTGPANG